MGNNFLSTFIFPFKLEQKQGRVDLNHVRELLKKAQAKVWKPDEFKITDGKGQCRTNRYNEFYYFHPFVRDVLLSKPDEKDVACFSRNDYDKLTLKYQKDGESDTITAKINSITAKINSISLHLFDVGVGFLSIETEKDNNIDFQKLLTYNDLTRRVYPPFLKENLVKLDPIKNDTILPDEITLSRTNPTDPSKIEKTLTESFENDTLEKCLNDAKPFLSNIIQELLAPFQFRANMKKNDMARDVIYYMPFTDDRMFVISWFLPEPSNPADHKIAELILNPTTGSGKKASSFLTGTSGTAKKEYSYKNSEEWYKFVFVDGKEKGIHNAEMMEKLIAPHTYARHVEDGSLYGMSRYSFVCLCKEDNEKTYHEIIKGHMQSMYFRMAILVILQRAILLKFSEDIGAIAKDFDGKTVIDDASVLHGNFIKYINKYRTLEASPQEQGIEIYNQWMDIFDIERLFQEAQREISDMAEYIENKIESNRNDKMAIITIIGVPLAIIGLILSFWQTFNESFLQHQSTYLPCLKQWAFLSQVPSTIINCVTVCIIGIIIGLIMLGVLLPIVRSGKRLKKRWKP